MDVQEIGCGIRYLLERTEGAGNMFLTMEELVSGKQRVAKLCVVAAVKPPKATTLLL
jgi:hypothetical protein